LARARKLAAEAAAIIGYAFDGVVVELYANDNFLGAGCGIPSAEGQHAIAATARAEGVFLDPTYTGKAMAGYLKLLSRGRYADTGAVLFLHTGGAPSLFTAAVEAML
jgi:1-aminocyclopropane-1-carboxylate deaminase/D-cysteine desulfhydrase-like pyridoxal-dependent ACC family enzyme